MSEDAHSESSPFEVVDEPVTLKPADSPAPWPGTRQKETMVQVPVTVILAAQSLVGLPPTGKWDDQTLLALQTYVSENVLSTDGWPDAWKDAYTRIHGALTQLPVAPDERLAWLGDIHRSVTESL